MGLPKWLVKSYFASAQNSPSVTHVPILLVQMEPHGMINQLHNWGHKS